jgi:periplasmic protein TonB
MNGAIIYRPGSRKLTLTAFACAVAIHVTVIALAENRSKAVALTFTDEPSDGPIVELTDPLQPEEPQIVLPVEPNVIPDQEFVDENVAPRPIRPRKKTPVAPVVRSTGIGSGRATQSGFAKALALYAPRPSYPYQARRGNVTGSGVAELSVNSGNGNVIDAHMAQSTGSAVLDNATIETLRRWKFKPGVASNIAVPITYTLTGVSY